MWLTANEWPQIGDRVIIKLDVIDTEGVVQAITGQDAVVQVGDLHDEVPVGLLKKPDPAT